MEAIEIKIGQQLLAGSDPAVPIFPDDPSNPNPPIDDEKEVW